MVDKNKNKKVPSVILDILIVIFLMLFSIACRVPSLMTTQDSSLRDENNLQYLYDPDSYYYARRTRNVLETGDYSLKTPATDDQYHIATEGTYDYNFFPVSMAIIFQCVNFLTHIPLEVFFVIIGPIINSFSVIPIYVFIKKRTKNRLAAIVGAFFAGVNAATFGKTCFRSFDTDILLFVLPATYACAYLDALSANTNKKRALYILISSLAFFALAATWPSYSPYYYLVVVATIVLFVLKLVKEKNFKRTILSPEVLTSIICSICYIAVCFLLCGGIDLSVFSSILSILNDPFKIGEYPSPGIYVSELQSAPLYEKNMFSVRYSGMINIIGGLTVFAGLLAIMTYYVVTDIKKKFDDIPFHIETIFLTIWIVGGMVGLFAGIRFLRLLAIPISIVLGLGLFRTKEILQKLNMGYLSIFFAILITLPTFGVAENAKELGQHSSDNLVSASRYIDENVHKDSRSTTLIVSWWDYGYIYEYESKVRTLMDGGTFNGKSYQDIARAFLAKDTAGIQNRLKEYIESKNLKATKLFVIIESGLIEMQDMLEYYANYGLDGETEFSYDDSSMLKALYLDKKDIDNIHFEKSFGEKENEVIIYSIDINVDY